MSKAWKNAEREACQLVGALRRHRVMYSESIENGYDRTFVIEIKYGKQIPKYAIPSMPVVINERFVVFSTQHIHGDRWLTLTKVSVKRVTFLEKGMQQAVRYNIQKPLLILKPKFYRGMIICMYASDYPLYFGTILRRMNENTKNSNHRR